MSIRSILKKRNEDYLIANKNIVELCGEKIVKALRFFTKTEKDIVLKSINFHSTNSNFVIIVYSIPFDIGDIIQLSSGKTIEITEEIMKTVQEELMNMIIPVNMLDDATALELYEKMKYYDEFVSKHGIDHFNKCVESGMPEIIDMNSEKYEKTLDEITDPINSFIEKMDKIQKLEYTHYSKNKVIN